MNIWWDGKPEERFWLEVTDREDIGADLRAPLLDDSGRDNWRYSLFQHARVGDVVFHYKKPAIVGFSTVAGRSVPAQITWAARGSYARSKGTEPRDRPGYRIPLSKYTPLQQPVSLADLRAHRSELERLTAGRAGQRNPPQYLPFELSPNRDLRVLQGYAFKLPASLVDLLPALRVGASALSPVPGVPVADDERATEREATARTRYERPRPGASRIARISYNSAGWTRPTGDAAGSEAKGTYNARTGFGHEDWLFRDEWHVDGWRYAFLQGVHSSRTKLLKLQAPIDVLLFTLKPGEGRRYVARITDVECLSNEQAKDALSVFRDRGWLSTMRDEVAAIGGDVAALDDPRAPPSVLNVRFRRDNVLRLDIAVEANDPVANLSRYQLIYARELSKTALGSAVTGRAGQGVVPVLAPYVRKALDAVLCTPEHSRMAAKLHEELKAEHPNDEILFEENFVDVIVRSHDGDALYEIKTDLSARTVLRQAIGQLLEYAHHGEKSRRTVRLVAVGRVPLSLQDSAYLARLREAYGLALEYRVVTL